MSELNWRIYDLTEEPQGELYRRILDYAISICDTALLVVYPRVRLADEAAAVLERLRPLLVSREETDEWPGTKLIGHKATVFRFRYGRECAEVLKAAANSLYQWAQPALPEFLCLLRPGEEPWLVFLTDDEEAYFKTTKEEMDLLLEALPELRSMVREAESTDPPTV